MFYEINSNFSLLGFELGKPFANYCLYSTREAFLINIYRLKLEFFNQNIIKIKLYGLTI